VESYDTRAECFTVQKFLEFEGPVVCFAIGPFCILGKAVAGMIEVSTESGSDRVNRTQPPFYRDLVATARGTDLTIVVDGRWPIEEAN